MNLRVLLTCLLATFGWVATAGAQIQAGRAIQISISGVPAEETQRINQIYPVSESGMINMPFIGKVQAAGLRAEQLASSLEGRYKAAGIYRNPTFQVIDSSQKTIEEQVVVVGGQVSRPGPVPYTRTLTLYQAIQAGGGATPFGSMKRVKVFRNGRQKQYDLTKAQFMHIPLEPNDTIEVPQKTVLGN